MVSHPTDPLQIVVAKSSQIIKVSLLQYDKPNLCRHMVEDNKGPLDLLVRLNCSDIMTYWRFVIAVGAASLEDYIAIPTQFALEKDEFKFFKMCSDLISSLRWSNVEDNYGCLIYIFSNLVSHWLQNGASVYIVLHILQFTEHTIASTLLNIHNGNRVFQTILSNHFPLALKRLWKLLGLAALHQTLGANQHVQELLSIAQVAFVNSDAYNSLSIDRVLEFYMASLF